MTDRDPGSSVGEGGRALQGAGCDSCAAGHGVHPRRVQLCDGGPDDDWSAVVVMGAVGDVLTVAAGEELRRYRNHDAGRLTQLVDEVGSDALLNRRFGLLFLRTWPRDAGAVFSLQSADQPPSPCQEPNGR
ncbi:hypothetical protein [Geodermatophilus sp. CPCC 205506]|uniref:hypothetical protein n=1 Tax=Geodermatophilus sp. CPCC 205506 TaxID=2936596 RepID=UPI003EE8A3E2